MGMQPMWGGWRAGVVVLVALTLLVAPVGSFAQDKSDKAPDKAAKTLYERMGGYDVLSAVVEDFIAQLGKDPAFDRFGHGRGINSLVRTKQLIKDQVCHMTDGPCAYIGRDMAPAHQGLGITAKEWESAGAKLQASLGKCKVPAKEKAEFMALIDKLKDDIIEKPKKDETKPATASPGQN